MATNEVSVDITVEEKAALKALTRLSQGFDKTEKKATASVGKMDLALATFAGNIVANVAGKAISFLVSSLGEVVDAAQRQEDAINSLNAALRQSGDFSGAASQDLQDYASELQKITRFGDEAIIEQLAFAKSMGATTEQAKKIVAAATDMSAALNMDFNAAVRNITKTLGGLKGELGESISELGLLTKEQLQAGAAIDLIAGKFAGQAQAATATYSGRVEQLSNSWGDLLENVGMFVTKNPAVLSAIDSVASAVGALNEIIGTKSNEKQIDETTSRYAELSEKVSETEAEIKRLQESGGFFKEFQINAKTKDLQMFRMELNKLALDQEKQRMIQKAQAEEEAAAQAAKGEAPAKDPKTDPRYVAEQQLQAELKLLREQTALAEEEAELRKKEAQGLATEQDLEALRNIELIKIDIIAQSELEKAALIADAEKRSQETKRINAKYGLDIARATAKQEVDIEKAKAAEKAAIQKSVIQTTQNFLAAGLTLAKQGSAEQKALATANALISTYSAANQALKAPPGPPWSFALAASTVAMGLANVAKINKESFATGGVVGGFSGASMGMDNTTANVRTGEMVLNGNQQRQLFDVANGKGVSDDLASEIRMLRMDMQTQPVVVQVDGIEIARAVRDSREEGFAV
jgi:hypothetical protein